jgi:hypothetical protein
MVIQSHQRAFYSLFHVPFEPLVVIFQLLCLQSRAPVSGLQPGKRIESKSKSIVEGTFCDAGRGKRFRPNLLLFRQNKLTHRGLAYQAQSVLSICNLCEPVNESQRNYTTHLIALYVLCRNLQSSSIISSLMTRYKFVNSPEQVEVIVTLFQHQVNTLL